MTHHRGTIDELELGGGEGGGGEGREGGGGEGGEGGGGFWSDL
jgi:hypothetical protein